VGGEQELRAPVAGFAFRVVYFEKQDEWRPLMAAKKNKSKTKNTTKRKTRKSSPKITITGTIAALKDLAVDASKIPGLIIRRAGF
jgi:hypothetical protein